MATFEIPSIDSPNVMCEFKIPRPGKSDLVFTIPRMDFAPDFDIKLQKWAGDRMKIGKDGDGNDVTPEPIDDREALLTQLRIAGGLPASTMKQLEALAMGQLNLIYSHWSDASKVDLGESDASDS